jgi:predicted DNA-binding protein (UPF0251 family)
VSPRNKSYRKILSTPDVKGFKPYGLKAGTVFKDTVNLNYEEYEALRLFDYLKYDQLKASELMDISRPTFTRIYREARKKLAIAIVEGRKFIIEGGKVWLDSTWHNCSDCHCIFTIPGNRNDMNFCPLCGSLNVTTFNPPAFNDDEKSRQCETKCVCPNCGYEQEQEFGIPCHNLICPECRTHLSRKKQSDHFTNI